MPPERLGITSLPPAITPTNWVQRRHEWPADPSDGDEAGEASLFDTKGDGSDVHLVIDILEEPGSPEKARSVSIPGYARKGIAALCLDDVPFGFTHDEREAVIACVGASAAGEPVPALTRKLAMDAAAKMFALLRPSSSL